MQKTTYIEDKFKVGNTVYCIKYNTKYEVQGFWKGFVVVLGPSGHPCLKTYEQLTSKPQTILKVRPLGQSIVYYKRVASEDGLFEGKILVDLISRRLFEVIEINPDQAVNRKHIEDMKAYHLGKAL